jgi:cytochrome c1
MLKFLGVIGLLAILGAIGAGVFFVGGFFTVAATQEDPGIVTWALTQVRMASIARHATDDPPGPLDDSATVQAGAKAYATRGCTNCHGGPGVEWQKFSEGLNPGPPDLSEVAPNREPRELFWVIKNGIKMTGMPSFKTAGVPDKDIWSIVAFVKKLPSVSEADYKAWTTGTSTSPNPVTTVPR